MSDLISAARSGNRRETLEALRDKIAASIQNCESGRDVAALSKRLMEVMGELDALPRSRDDSPLARAKRGAAIAASARREGAGEDGGGVGTGPSS